MTEPAVVFDKLACGYLASKLFVLNILRRPSKEAFRKEKLREMISSHKELTHKLSELEQQLESHDEQIQVIIETIKQLMQPSKKPRKRIS